MAKPLLTFDEQIQFILANRDYSYEKAQCTLAIDFIAGNWQL